MQAEIENIKKLSEVLQFSLKKLCEESYVSQMEELGTAADDYKQFQEDYLPYINDSLLWLQHLIMDKNTGAISVDKECR